MLAPSLHWWSWMSFSPTSPRRRTDGFQGAAILLLRWFSVRCLASLVSCFQTISQDYVDMKMFTPIFYGVDDASAEDKRRHEIRERARQGGDISCGEVSHSPEPRLGSRSMGLCLQKWETFPGASSQGYPGAPICLI